jgi:amino-acid N-acetyltransferase
MKIRTAAPGDICSIMILVNDHARRGDLLPRSALSIRDTLPDWLVGELNGEIVACGSLRPYTPVLAEVRSLAVHDDVKGQGLGSALLQALIAEARRRYIPTLFALTRAVSFFKRAGFTITEKERFPEKVWRDCNICPIKHRCDETAVVLNLAIASDEAKEGNSSTAHAPRSTLHALRSTLHAPRSTPHAPRFTFLA